MPIRSGIRAYEGGNGYVTGDTLPWTHGQLFLRYTKITQRLDSSLCSITAATVAYVVVVII